MLNKRCLVVRRKPTKFVWCTNRLLNRLHLHFWTEPMRDTDMKLIDEILDDVYQRPTLQSSQILASAIASTCNSDVTINLFDVLSWLNTKNKARLWRLINV
jgi:hypothetical protein